MSERCTYKDAMKDCRAAAKRVNLVFKKQNMRINGAQAFMFYDKRRSEKALSNCTLWMAWENVCSGFVDSYNSEVGQFERRQKTEDQDEYYF